MTTHVAELQQIAIHEPGSDGQTIGSKAFGFMVKTTKYLGWDRVGRSELAITKPVQCRKSMIEIIPINHATMPTDLFFDARMLAVGQNPYYFVAPCPRQQFIWTEMIGPYGFLIKTEKDGIVLNKVESRCSELILADVILRTKRIVIDTTFYS